MASYSSYVSHIIRFYVRNPQPEFRTEVDRINWLSVQRVMETLGKKEREIVSDVFQCSNLNDGLRFSSDKHQIPELIVWQTVRRISERVAQERGLI